MEHLLIFLIVMVSALLSGALTLYTVENYGLIDSYNLSVMSQVLLVWTIYTAVFTGVGIFIVIFARNLFT